MHQNRFGIIFRRLLSEKFLLLYDDVRATRDPKRAILDFAQSTYEAGARLQGWLVYELALQVERPPQARERPQETSELAASKAPNPTNASNATS